MFLLRLILLFCVFAGATAQAQTPVEKLLIAAQDSDLQVVTELIRQGMPADTVDPAGNSLLMITARYGHVDMAQLLLILKANVHHRNAVGDTPLMFSAMGGSVEVARVLLKNGAKVNRPGWTALHYCAAAGKTAMCQFLLDQGADIDARAPNGTTPLMMAVREGHFDTVRLLVWEVADVSIRNAAGATALQWAERAKREDIVTLLQQAGARD